MKRPLLAKCLRDVLQLHHIIVQKTYKHPFSTVIDHEAPIYDMKTKDEFAKENDDRIRRGVFLTGDGHDSGEAANPPCDRMLNRVWYTTMLRTGGEHVED